MVNEYCWKSYRGVTKMVFTKEKCSERRFTISCDKRKISNVALRCDRERQQQKKKKRRRRIDTFAKKENNI